MLASMLLIVASIEFCLQRNKLVEDSVTRSEMIKSGKKSIAAILLEE